MRSNLLLDLRIAFCTENILRLPDHDLVGHKSIAVFIHHDGRNLIQRRILILVRLILRRRQLVHDLTHNSRRTEHSPDVLKEEIGQETMPHHLHTLESARDREHLCRIQLHHLPLIILTEHREEIQQAVDILLPRLTCPTSIRRQRREIVGELVEDDERTRGVKVKDIHPLLTHPLSICPLQPTRILRTERRLHIGGGTLQIAQHEHPTPLRDRHAHRQLSHTERDCPRMRADCLAHTVIRRIIHAYIIERTVSRREHDLIVPKDRVVPQQPRQSLCTRNTVQQP